MYQNQLYEQNCAKKKKFGNLISSYGSLEFNNDMDESNRIIESKAKSNRKRIRVKDNNPIAYKYFDQLD